MTLDKPTLKYHAEIYLRTAAYNYHRAAINAAEGNMTRAARMLRAARKHDADAARAAMESGA